MHQSEELTQFYRAYRKWVKDGSKSHPDFGKNYGLCLSMDCYRESEKFSIYLKDEFKDQLKLAGLDIRYPFNDGDYDKYREDCTKGVMHLNQARIDWVNSHC